MLGGGDFEFVVAEHADLLFDLLAGTVFKVGLTHVAGILPEDWGDEAEDFVGIDGGAVDDGDDAAEGHVLVFQIGGVVGGVGG